MLNKDYKDMLQCLSDARAEYLLVGAYAMAVHGYPRATADMDLWVLPSPGNAAAVLEALRHFGAPLHDLSEADLEKDDTVFQIGVAPRRIDIITSVSGLTFEAAVQNAIEADIEGLRVQILSIQDLIRNKTATGRAKDLADVDALRALHDEKQN